MTLPDMIEYVVKRYDYVSFAELQGQLSWLTWDKDLHLTDDDIPDISGEHALVSNADENIIYWQGLSIEATDALIELLAAKRIFTHPASILSYLIDGQVPRLPIVKRFPKGGYKKLHWFPVVLRAVPLAKRRRKHA